MAGRSSPEYWRKYRKRKPEASRNNVLRKYGLNTASYTRMLQEQNGVCYICHRPPTGRHPNGTAISLHVDHNHLTGEVRKLLCSRCNQAIGLLDEVPDRIRAAAAYLEEHDHEYTTY